MKNLSVTGHKGEQLVTRLLEMRGRYEDGNMPAFEQMSLCEDFTIGEQWDPDDFAYNEAKRRHSLTINQILPTVMQIIGNEVQNPRDIEVMNLTAKEATKTRLITALAKAALDRNQATRKKSKMFQAGVTNGRAYMGMDVDYEMDPERGDLEVKTASTFMVLPDPSCQQYNMNAVGNGARGLIVDEWMPKDLIHGWWPKRQRALGATNYDANRTTGFSNFVERLHSMIFGAGRQWDTKNDYRQQRNRFKNTEKEEFNRWKDDYRVSTYFWKTYKPGAMLRRLDQPSRFQILTTRSAIKYAEERLEANPQTPAVLIKKDRLGRPLMVPILNKALLVGNVPLAAWEDPYDGIHDYPYVRFSPYFFDGKEFGLVDNLIGPQQTLNASWSMGMNLLKQLANTGYKVGESHKLWLDWLEQNGGNDGVVIPLDKFGGVVERMEPNPYPVAADGAAERSTQHIAEIANVRREMPTFDSKDMSGRAILAKQNAAMTGSASPFGNYDATSEQFAVLTTKMILQANMYSEDEIRSLVDEEDLIDPEMFEQARELIIATLPQDALEQPTPPEPSLMIEQDLRTQQDALEQYSVHKRAWHKMMDDIDEATKELAIDMLLDELPRLKYGKLAARASVAEAAATFRERKAAEMIDLNNMLLASQYQPVPREDLINATDVPGKERIIAAQVGDGRALQEQQPAPAGAA